MKRKLPLLVGTVFIILGLAALALNIIVPVLGLDWYTWGGWQFWPMLILGMGMLFVLAPLIIHERGMGGLFIPGALILANGAILAYTSTFDAWHAWEWLWPIEVLSLALGFLLAALYMRNVWLVIPAIILGANGALFQFCALTGMWEVWAVLWAIEPLSVGAALFVCNLKYRKNGLLIAAMILCSLSAFAIVMMSAILPYWTWLNLIGPAVIVLLGVALLIHALTRKQPENTEQILPVE